MASIWVHFPKTSIIALPRQRALHLLPVPYVPYQLTATNFPSRQAKLSHLSNSNWPKFYTAEGDLRDQLEIRNLPCRRPGSNITVFR